MRSSKSDVRTIYFLVAAPFYGIGVNKKYHALAKGFDMIDGFRISIYESSVGGLPKYYLLLLRLIHVVSKSKRGDYLFVRSGPFTNVILGIVYLLRLRSFLPEVIWEVPTPYSSAINESRDRLIPASILSKVGNYIARLSSFVVCYSFDESYGPNNTLVLGNWSVLERPHLDRIRNRQCIGKSSSRKVVDLVLIANLAPWHGADLLIESIQTFNRESREHFYALTIASQRNRYYEALRKDTEGFDFLVFRENVTEEEMKDLLTKTVLGVGTLGSHRKLLKSASPIKHRDYAVYGLPVLYDVCDVDIDELPGIGYSLGSLSSDRQVVESLREFLWMYASVYEQIDHGLIACTAWKNLSYEAKANKLKSFLMSAL